MPKPRGREIPTIQRQRILDEAIRLIGRSGYHGFTIQELAQRCDLTNGGLLYYFGSKELLLIAVLEERDRRAAAAIPASLNLARETPESGGYTRPAVLEIFDAIVRRSVAEPEVLRLLHGPAIRSTGSRAPGARLLPKTRSPSTRGVRQHRGRPRRKPAIGCTQATRVGHGA